MHPNKSITENLDIPGWSVTDTMRKGVIDVQDYVHAPHELMLGQLAILGGTAAWLAITTALSMPVSTTHAVVGATLGFSLVLRGTEGINWDAIYTIIASWFLSPALSGTISVVLYLIVDFAVLRRNHPFECGLRSLPIFYFFVISFNVFMATWDGSKPSSSADEIESVRTSSFKTIQLRASSESDDCSESGGIVASCRQFLNWFLPDKDRVDDEKTIQLFGTIQIFTACFAGFAIGANDVGGFTIEFGAALTTLIASKFGLPISTTQCLIGSVVLVGCVRSGEGVKWSVFRNIVIAWP
ncbi:phosphate transporter family protein [Ancylostoma duodenale]|uniref:Phosphate transporter family protein n=1 Tax=Ancylostoma duodenale TaxID=51022 RepID=A0A0C2GLU6_9BILA|nr:phosphate transporter family protein [Ancylostoma duodenale]